MYFYPRSPCGERLQEIRKPLQEFLFLSTLSLRRATEEQKALDNTPIFLSTLSLRRATLLTMFIFCSMIFLSTLSLRRATYHSRGLNRAEVNFYPRSPCGERPVILFRVKSASKISIHALLAESDSSVRLSLSGSTISIHALLAESDLIHSKQS